MLSAALITILTKIKLYKNDEYLTAISVLLCTFIIAVI